MREIRFRGKHKYGGKDHGCLYVGRAVDRDITKDRDLARRDAAGEGAVAGDSVRWRQLRGRAGGIRGDSGAQRDA